MFSSCDIEWFGDAEENPKLAENTIYTFYSQSDEDYAAVSRNDAEKQISVQRTFPVGTVVLPAMFPESEIKHSRSGYVFKGWKYYRKSFFNKDTTPPFNVSLDNKNMVNRVYSTIEYLDFVAVWRADNIVDYKVEHYFENIEDNGYTINEEYSSTKEGEIDSLTEAEEVVVEGFVPLYFDQVLLVKDVESIVRIYYKRKQITYQIDFNLPDNQEPYVVQGKYGGSIFVTYPERENYVIKEWINNNTGEKVSVLPQTFGPEDLSFTAIWKPSSTVETPVQIEFPSYSDESITISVSDINYSDKNIYVSVVQEFVLYTYYFNGSRVTIPGNSNSAAISYAGITEPGTYEIMVVCEDIEGNQYSAVLNISIISEALK